MIDISRVLDPGEGVVWEGKPKSRLFMLTRTFPILIFGCFWMTFITAWESTAIGIFTIQSKMTSETSMSQGSEIFSRILSTGFPCFGLPFVLVGLFLLSTPILSLLSFKNIRYYITTKRVILSSGIIGKDFKFIDFDRIQNTSVNVGLIDNLFGHGNTGTIAIFSGEMGQSKNGSYAKNDYFVGIENPYEVARLLKSVSYDIKTDIEYPNKLRPDINPGYQTEYKPENPTEVK